MLTHFVCLFCIVLGMYLAVQELQVPALPLCSAQLRLMISMEISWAEWRHAWVSKSINRIIIDAHARD
ncbi:hypothetical protein BDW72DRAFT_178323 [Aspergillus terricola var. indicus]